MLRHDLEQMFVDGGRFIGRGTFAGGVYAMRFVRTGEPCAVKIMTRLDYDGEIEQWDREKTALDHIRHPNIVSYLGMVRHIGNEWIAIGMELCDLTLHAYLSNRLGTIASEVARSLAGQLCSGVGALHAEGLMHRDLKPRNVFIKLTHVAPQLQVGDLGSCRCFNTGQARRKRYKATTRDSADYTPFLGTLAYRAPELVFGSVEYGQHVDSWSIGCIVSELFSGARLFPCKCDSDLAASMVELLGDPEATWPANAGPIEKILGPTFSTLGTSGTPSLNKMPAAPSTEGSLQPAASSLPAEIVSLMLQWYPPSRMAPGLAEKKLNSTVAPLATPPPQLAPQSELLLPLPALPSELAAPPPPPPLPSEEDSSRSRTSPLAAPSTEGSFSLNRYYRHRHAPGAVCRCYEADSPCECSGNCMTRGHRLHGCKGLAKMGSRFCPYCECRLGYCTGPRHNGQGLCKPHSRIALTIGPALRLAASATPVLPRMFPCDAAAVLEMFPPLFRPRAPLILLIILAMLKEPTAMKAWLTEWKNSLAAAASTPGITGEQLAAALERLAI